MASTGNTGGRSRQSIRDFVLGGGQLPPGMNINPTYSGPPILNRRGRAPNRVPGNLVVHLDPNRDPGGFPNIPRIPQMNPILDPNASIGIGDFERDQIRPPTTGGSPTFAEPLRPPGSSTPMPQAPGAVRAPTGGAGPLPGIAPDLPTTYQYQPGAESGMLQDVFNRATTGSTNEFNLAANRLRERIDTGTRSAQNQAANRNLSRGFAASGMADAERSRIGSAGQQAYGQGLVDLMDRFEKNRLQGLGIGLGAAQGQAGVTEGLNRIQAGDFGGLRNSLFDLLNSREGRSSTEYIAELQDRLQRDLQRGEQRFLGGENEEERSLREWLASIGIGADKIPQIIGMPGLGGSIGEDILNGGGITLF